MKLLILAAALLAQASTPQAPPTGGAAPAGTLLVGNKGENTVSFIDLASGRELGRAPTGPMPHEIAISPDGRQAAVVAYGGSTIDIFDVRTRERLRRIDLSPNDRPHGIVWLADGRIIATTERSRSLSIVDLRGAQPAVTSIATDQQGSHMVAVSPDARRAYTANIGSGTVSVIDLAGRTKLRDLPVGGQPEGIALTPDGRTLWVGDLQGARVTAWDTNSFERVAELSTGPVPIRVLASPDGRWIVTSNLQGGNLSLIDAARREVVRTIQVSGSGDARQVTILFSRDGRYLYAAETGRNQVAEIEMATGQVRRRLMAGQDGDGLAIAPAR